jgi:exonuclease III
MYDRGTIMRIVSWNCGGWSCGGFNINKYNEMKRYQPQILLIQECTKKEFNVVSKAIAEERINLINSLSKNNKINFDYSKLQHWYGDKVEESYKGTAIFSPMGMYNVELLDNFNDGFRYVIPYKIFFVASFPDIDDFILLSVWTKPPSDGSWNYQKTIFDALDYYNFNKPIILVGDFNTGSNKNNIHRYKELKTNLEKYGLKNCAQNTEFEYVPTFFHDKTNDYFTNDFCFIPNNYNINEFYVDRMNNQKRWHGLSDHCPIIADFDLPDRLTKKQRNEIDTVIKQESQYDYKRY